MAKKLISLKEAMNSNIALLMDCAGKFDIEWKCECCGEKMLDRFRMHRLKDGETMVEFVCDKCAKGELVITDLDWFWSDDE